ncbi:hypothetical protein AB835_12140 [Candidatus Endobugula sertula]|uniref:Uncharacterized protein n=1 Tax=Candidatus Endobugula sertula TaxID=62101 RepID=A0A1D2QMK6_9GAMM|nr:hypothetical protein AB835_12140 [Candidatus Endobugula sertula]
MINDIEKTPQMKALELAQARETLAQYYKDTLTQLEKSRDPLALTKDIINAPENNAILKAEQRSLFRHIEQEGSQSHSDIQGEEKTFRQYDLANKDDLDKAIRLLAAKELNDYHREEIETLNERQKANLDHEQDLNALLALHVIEEKAFQQSHNPLEETRAIIENSHRFNSFEDYAASRLQESKTMTAMHEQAKESKSMIELDDEAFLRGHLQQVSEQKAFDNIEAPPSLYESYFADNEKWPKEMFVEGSFVQYSEFDNTEHHSIDWQKHDFSQHHITLEIQQSNALTHDDRFGIEP